MRSMAVGFKGTGRDGAVGLRERNVRHQTAFTPAGNTFKSN